MDSFAALHAACAKGVMGMLSGVLESGMKCLRLGHIFSSRVMGKNDVESFVLSEMCDPLGVDILCFAVFLYTFDPLGVAYL